MLSVPGTRKMEILQWAVNNPKTAIALTTMCTTVMGGFVWIVRLYLYSPGRRVRVFAKVSKKYNMSHAQLTAEHLLAAMNGTKVVPTSRGTTGSELAESEIGALRSFLAHILDRGSHALRGSPRSRDSPEMDKENIEDG
jgi:hypothetical protein